MSRIVDDPIGYDLGALEDWSVLRFGLDCGRRGLTGNRRAELEGE